MSGGGEKGLEKISESVHKITTKVSIFNQYVFTLKYSATCDVVNVWGIEEGSVKI